MSKLRIIELEQQLKRRDERLNEIETKVKQLTRYSTGYGDGMFPTDYGSYVKISLVLGCFK